MRKLYSRKAGSLMSQHREQGGAQTRLSHPTGSVHTVHTPDRMPWGNPFGRSGWTNRIMVVAHYNDDGSFTGEDGLRYVERTVLFQEDKREPLPGTNLNPNLGPLVDKASPCPRY